MREGHLLGPVVDRIEIYLHCTQEALPVLGWRDHGRTGATLHRVDEPLDTRLDALSPVEAVDVIDDADDHLLPIHIQSAKKRIIHDLEREKREERVRRGGESRAMERF
jgi:hypothetical protein